MMTPFFADACRRATNMRRLRQSPGLMAPFSGISFVYEGERAGRLSLLGFRREPLAIIFILHRH